MLLKLSKLILVFFMPLGLLANDIAGKGLAGISGFAAGKALAGMVIDTEVATEAKACCSPMSSPCCLISITAAAAAVSMAGTASDSYNHKDISSCENTSNSTFCNWNNNLGDGTNTGGGNPNDPSSFAVGDGSGSGSASGGGGPQFSNFNGGIANVIRANEQIIDELKSKGYNLSSDYKYISTPDGKQIPTSALASPAALENQGFSSQSVGQAFAAIDNAKNKMNLANDLNKYGFGYSGGSGAGWKQAGKRGTSNKGPDYNKMFNQFLNKDKKGAKQARGVAAAAGLSKKLSNGENIGVAADNIFHMVHRRYQKKTAEKSFMP